MALFSTHHAAPKRSAPDFETVANDLQRLLQDAQRLMHEVVRFDDVQIDRLRDRVHDQIDQFSRRIGTVRASAGEVAQGVAAKASESARRADAVVTGHPYASIGFAAAVGTLLGLVLGQVGPRLHEEQTDGVASSDKH